MSRPGFPSDRMKRIDDLIDCWVYAAGVAAAVAIVLLIGFVVAVRVSGGAS